MDISRLLNSPSDCRRRSDEANTRSQSLPMTVPVEDAWVQRASLQDKEDLAYKLLSSLPISNLARLQRKIAPLLQVDIVGFLATELALLIFSYLPYQTLLDCALVSRRWRALANDSFLWKQLCVQKGWQWRQPLKARFLDIAPAKEIDDEGVGEDEDDWTAMDVDSGLPTSDTTMSIHLPPSPRFSKLPSTRSFHSGTIPRYSAPAVLPSQSPPLKPDYKLLYQTHTLLHNRLIHSSYRRINLQTPQTPNSHTSTIYCLQLHTFPDQPDCPGRQVLFTGSRDRTIRQWDLTKGTVERVFEGVHRGSVLSICVRDDYIVSGGNDQTVVIWDIETGEVVKVIRDHLDSVLCVRLDETRLVSCSKDRTVRTYLLPNFSPHLILNSHRAAVNAVALSSTQIVSASGDRSIRLWDANTGDLLCCFEGHHGRGIASIDFAPPYILSGSSDRHLRLHNVLTSHGWCTSPYFEPYVPAPAPGAICQTCGEHSAAAAEQLHPARAVGAHLGLVRSVALGDKYVLSGSYDQTIKVWDRITGELIADLVGGHTGKIFCVGFDCTKIVSCGEDQRICIWDFAHGVDTSFIKL